MEIKNLFSGGFMLILGIIIGAGFTKNKYVVYILISLLVFRFIFSLLFQKAMRVKESTDKKVALRNEAVNTLNSAVDYTEYGHEVGGRIFDKWYGDYIFFLNIILVMSIFYFLIMHMWMYALINFIGTNVFIILNQIVRKVKHLGIEEKEVPLGKLLEDPNENKE